MKKLSVFIILLLFLVGCSQNDAKHNTNLEESIYSVVGDKKENQINILSLTTFDWDKAFLFVPYSTQEGIEEQLGTEFKDQSNIDIRDDIYLLVFLNKDKVIQYAEIERQGTDFSIGEKGYVTPSEDVINIERH